MTKQQKIRKKISPHLDRLFTQFAEMFGVQTYDRTFFVEPKDEERDGVYYCASIDVKEDYQRIYISLYPRFFTDTREHQRQYILHEFCHYFADDLNLLVHDLLEGKLVTQEQRRMANEKAASRACNIIESLLLGFDKKAQQAYIAVGS